MGHYDTDQTPDLILDELRAIRQLLAELYTLLRKRIPADIGG
jgi:hypothetical protein